jgi:hypothetical protein
MTAAERAKEDAKEWLDDDRPLNLRRKTAREVIEGLLAEAKLEGVMELNKEFCKTVSADLTAAHERIKELESQVADTERRVAEDILSRAAAPSINQSELREFIKLRYLGEKQ